MCGEKQAFREPEPKPRTAEELFRCRQERAGRNENPAITRIRAGLYNDPRLSDTYRAIVMEIVESNLNGRSPMT